MKLWQIVGVTSLGLTLSISQASGLELTAGHVNPPGEPSHLAFAALAERLAESDVDLSLIVFPQGQIGTETDAIEQVRLAALDMTTVGNSNLSNFAPSTGVLDIPFLFRDATEHPRAIAEGDIGAELAARIEQESGLKVLGWWSAGQRHVFTRDTAVSTPEDLVGLKIRVIGSPVYLDTFNQLGAQATGMPYGEVYSALANGTIDAAENDTSGYRNMKFWEQAPQLSLTGHFFLFKPVLINPQVLERMSDEQRQTFMRIFAEVTDMQWQLFASNFESDLEKLRAAGVTITEPDIDAFRKAVQPVVEKYQQNFGEDLVQRIRNAH